jgi:hypothetical protein
VVDLTDPGGEIAVLAKPLRQGHDFREFFAKRFTIVIADKPGLPGIESSQHGGPAGSATRQLAISAVEADAVRRESIHVRRAGHRVAIASQPGVEVVGEEQDDIGLLL